MVVTRDLYRRVEVQAGVLTLRFEKEIEGNKPISEIILAEYTVGYEPKSEGSTFLMIWKPYQVNTKDGLLGIIVTMFSNLNLIEQQLAEMLKTDVLIEPRPMN